jgi:RNA polymerase sigma factor (sigma-70 family)
MSDIKKFEHYTDIEIIHKIRNGENQLFELLIRRNNPFLYRIGRAYNYNHQDTEDLMQETYINAFYSLDKFQNNSSFKTWITRIMLNNCYQKKQKFSFQNEKPVERIQNEKNNPMFHNQSNTEKNVLNKELGQVLESALNAIPEEYRMVFAMRELNGLSSAETAEALSITESNVKVRLNRTKALLRSEIEKIYSPDDIFEFNLVYCDRIVENVMNKINSNTK